MSAGARIRIGCALGGHKMQSTSARRRCTAEWGSFLLRGVRKGSLVSMATYRPGVESANRQLVIRRAVACLARARGSGIQCVSQRPPVIPLLSSWRRPTCPIVLVQMYLASPLFRDTLLQLIKKVFSSHIVKK